MNGILHGLGHLLYGLALLGLTSRVVLCADPFRLDGASIIGWCGIAVGLAMVLWASAARKRSSGKGRVPFTTGGPYGFVRHPEYLAQGCIVVGMALLARCWQAWALAALLLLLLAFAIVEEEGRNVQRFGQIYLEYRQRVPAVNFLAGLLRRKSNSQRRRHPQVG